MELIDKPELQENNKKLFKGFFSNLKSCDEYIRFVFITGVTKLHKVRIFSDLKKFTNRTIYASDFVLKDYTGDRLDLLPMLYQTGYLTICDYDKHRKRYTLCFPNEEVKYGFLESLMPSYVPKATAGN